MNVNLLAGWILLISYYSKSAQYWYHAKKVGVVSAHSILHESLYWAIVVRQMVFTDVQITI
jgi:hypothetical protein